MVNLKNAKSNRIGQRNLQRDRTVNPVRNRNKFLGLETLNDIENQKEAMNQSF